jgi:hypothetical protein
MPDYSKGKIYTIRCRTDDTLIYVGSTIQSLAVRWGGHKVSSKEQRCKNRLIYTTINNNWDDWYIELHSLYPCNSREELCKKEGEIIREIGTLNIVINGRTYDEWYETYKNTKKEKNTDYYLKNKEQALEQAKEYYQNNKEKILEKNTQKITCECGCITTKQHLNRHKKSQKHTSFSSQKV